MLKIGIIQQKIFYTLSNKSYAINEKNPECIIVKIESKLKFRIYQLIMSLQTN